jgi:hypothetical protein
LILAILVLKVKFPNLKAPEKDWKRWPEKRRVTSASAEKQYNWKPGPKPEN